jgi:hypothetical protein
MFIIGTLAILPTVVVEQIAAQHNPRSAGLPFMQQARPRRLFPIIQSWWRRSGPDHDRLACGRIDLSTHDYSP